MPNGTLKKAQVQELFDKESMLIARRKNSMLIAQEDLVPEYRAIELFGASAVRRALESSPTEECDFDPDGEIVMFLNLPSFFMAATYFNTETALHNKKLCSSKRPKLKAVK